MKKLSNNGQKNKLKSAAIHITIAVITAVCISALILSLCAELLCKVDIPLFMSVPLATVSTCIAIFISAILLAYIHEERGMFFGFLLGIILFIILWILALVRGNSEFTSLATLKLVAFCTAGAIGGTVGILLKEKRRKMH
ncbi:MAG: TIGR04086 family membrane protein [Oscillospiraceae bacterium]